MKMSQFIKDLTELIEENGDAEVVYDTEMQVDLPEYNTDGGDAAYVFETPA